MSVKDAAAMHELTEQLSEVLAELRAVRLAIDGRDGLDDRVEDLESWRDRLGVVCQWLLRCAVGAGLAGAVAKWVTGGAAVDVSG